MKKKIKELTIKELYKICTKHPLSCVNCPLYKKFNCNNFSAMTKEELEKEIEL